MQTIFNYVRAALTLQREKNVAFGEIEKPKKHLVIVGIDKIRKLLALCLLITLCNCSNVESNKVTTSIEDCVNEYSFYNITYHGHDYVHFIICNGNNENHCIVHDPECHKCLDLFD